jgi:hypothetical protein
VIRDQRFKFHGEKMVSKFTFLKSFWAFQPELKRLRKNRFINKANRPGPAEHSFSVFLVKIIIFNKSYNAHVRDACDVM